MSLFFLCALLGAAPARAASAAARGTRLARGPYVVEASSVSALICWRPAGEAAGDRCRWRRGLAPGAAFDYSIGGAARTWVGKTLPASGPFTFAVFGDSGEGNRAQARVAKVLRGVRPDFVLLAGDIVYPTGKDKDYDARYFRPYADLLARIPFFPAPGNHDYGNYKRSAAQGERRYREGYFRVFHRPKYYSFDVANAHFVSLDTNAAYPIPAGAPVGPGSAQVKWLEQDLARSKARWKFVFLHVPLYASYHHGNYELLQASLQPVFERRGVDVVFQGHDHIYERSRPINGVVYVTAGIGGSTLRFWPERREWVQRQYIGFGLVTVAVNGGKIELKLLDDSGKVQDTLRLGK